MRFALISSLCLFCVSLNLFGQQTADLEPQLISSPRIKVPKEAKETSLGGKVSVLVSLDEAGNVSDVKEVIGPGFVCSSVDRPDVKAIREAARNLALQSKFSPAKRTGQFVDSTLWVTFDFPGRKGTSDFNFDVGDESKGLKYYNATNNTSPVNPKESSETLSGGALNGKASELPRPSYSPAARAVRASGPVPVQVLIDEQGKIFMAQPVDGHPLLRQNAVRAACRARFMPTLLSGEPVKVSGIITYNFVP